MFYCLHCPQSICFAIKIKSLCDIGAKLWVKIWFSHVCWRPSWIFVNTFFSPSVPAWHTFDLWCVDHNDPQTAIKHCISLNARSSEIPPDYKDSWLVWGSLTDHNLSPTNSPFTTCRVRCVYYYPDPPWAPFYYRPPSRSRVYVWPFWEHKPSAESLCMCLWKVSLFSFLSNWNAHGREKMLRRVL